MLIKWSQEKTLDLWDFMEVHPHDGENAIRSETGHKLLLEKCLCWITVTCLVVWDGRCQLSLSREILAKFQNLPINIFRPGHGLFHDVAQFTIHLPLHRLQHTVDFL